MYKSTIVFLMSMNFFMISAADEPAVKGYDEGLNVVEKLYQQGFHDLAKTIDFFKHPIVTDSAIDVPAMIYKSSITKASYFDYFEKDRRTGILPEKLSNGFWFKLLDRCHFKQIVDEFVLTRREDVNSLGGITDCKLAYCNIDGKKKKWVVKDYGKSIQEALPVICRVINAKRLQCLIKDLKITSIKVPDKYIISTDRSIYVGEEKIYLPEFYNDGPGGQGKEMSEVNLLEFIALNKIIGMKDLNSGNFTVYKGLLHLYDLEDRTFFYGTHPSQVNPENCLALNSYYDSQIAVDINLQKAKDQAKEYLPQGSESLETLGQSSEQFTMIFSQKIKEAKDFIASNKPEAQIKDTHARKILLYKEIDTKFTENSITLNPVIHPNDRFQKKLLMVELDEKIRNRTSVATHLC